MPSICVFGAGAIGGYMAAKLEAAGTPVSVVARGPHLAAMQADGLVLESGGERVVTRPRAVASGRGYRGAGLYSYHPEGALAGSRRCRNWRR